MIENPAVQFTLDAKAGEYDEVSDETYNFLLNEVEELSKFWCDQKEVPAVQILGAIFRKMNLDQKTIGAVAERLADRYAEEVKPFTECRTKGIWTGCSIWRQKKKSGAFSKRNLQVRFGSHLWSGQSCEGSDYAAL